MNESNETWKDFQCPGAIFLYDVFSVSGSTFSFFFCVLSVKTILFCFLLSWFLRTSGDFLCIFEWSFNRGFCGFLYNSVFFSVKTTILGFLSVKVN